MAPGEQLADGEESLARACWADNQEVAEFFPGRCGLDREDLVLAVRPQQ